MKTNLIIIASCMYLGAFGQSVTITPDKDITNVPRVFHSGNSNTVLDLRNNKERTELHFSDHLGQSKGSIVATEDYLSLIKRYGDLYVETLLGWVMVSASGNIGMNILSPTANLHVKEYSKLGEFAPAVKMKKVTATTPAIQGGCVDVNMGVQAGKILDYKVLVAYGTGTSGFVPEEYSIAPHYKFSTSISETSLQVCLHNGNSANIINKAIKVLITYEP